MNPRLIAISGTLKGTIFALTENETVIGREASNPVCLNDLSVSRRHCLIKTGTTDFRKKTLEMEETADLGRNMDPPSSDSHQFTIVDLESFNGTFVNGLPVKEHALAHGDQIAVGDVVLLSLLPRDRGGSQGSHPVQRGQFDHAIDNQVAEG